MAWRPEDPVALNCDQPRSRQEILGRAYSFIRRYLGHVENETWHMGPVFLIVQVSDLCYGFMIRCAVSYDIKISISNML